MTPGGDMNRYGYNGRILRIDLTKRAHRVETPDDNFWRLYGGGGLAAVSILLRDTAPGLDPLDPGNLLIFASSVVAGMDAPGLARFTTSAKSPLTGGIGETRTEGTWGPALKASGADILVIEGSADSPVAVEISAGGGSAGIGVTYHDAADLWGSTVDTAVDELERRLGGEIHTAVIGPAGENLVRFASIVTDRSFQASRMGMGAVMGSKRLKAVILKGGEAPSAYDPTALARIREEFIESIPENSLSKWQYDPPGFSCWIYLHGLDASLCAENYSKSEFPLLEAYEKEKYAGFRIEDLPCPGCPNNCIKSIVDPKSAVTDHRSGGIHQEITGTMGPNLGIGDLSFIAEGTKRAASLIGGKAPSFAMQAKGLEMVPFEPRSQTNLALGYAVAPIGPRYDICEHDWDFDTVVGWDHTLRYSRTLGILDRIPMSHMGPEKVRNFKALFTLWSAADALDFCIFAVAPTRILSMPMMAEILRAVTGWETSSYEIMRYGERRAHLMRWYNIREGLCREDDILPDRFYTQPISGGPQAGAVLDRARFVESVGTFYSMMGWDHDGVPLPATLYDIGLEWVLKEGGNLP